MRYANELIVEELRNSRDLRLIHLNEAIESLQKKDEFRAGLLMLRNLVNASCGFPKLAKDLGMNPKSVIRILTPGRNPKAATVFEIIHYLMSQDGGSFKIERKIKVA